MANRFPPRPASILAQIEHIRRARADAPKRAAQAQLAAILDGLNAWDALERLKAARFAPNLCHGPKVVDGLTPDPWLGAVVWHRPAGYYGYKTLTVTGVWAVSFADQDVIQIIAGSKRLAYSEPFYDAEAYYKLIRRDYTLYYRDNGAPPAGEYALIQYQPDQRLALRDWLAEQLAAAV